MHVLNTLNERGNTRIISAKMLIVDIAREVDSIVKKNFHSSKCLIFWVVSEFELRTLHLLGRSFII
jgi:hypothetical protein